MSITFDPTKHPNLFNLPARLTEVTAWQEHIPFAMFMISLLRPKLLVELGTHYGDSYCAFCQAVAELQTETRCYAVDAWKGDQQAGFYGPEVLADLRAYHDERYGAFSTLVQATFDEALDQFADSSIDLLHIDGLHTYEAVKHDYETWRPKLSQRGVVLFHDTNVPQPGYEVHRLWKELSAQFPHLHFNHGHGLGLLAVGAEQSPEMAQLLLANPEELAEMERLFQRLGQGLIERADFRELPKHPEALAQVNAVIAERLTTLGVWVSTKLAATDVQLNQQSQQRARDAAQLAQYAVREAQDARQQERLERQAQRLREKQEYWEARSAQFESQSAQFEARAIAHRQLAQGLAQQIAAISISRMWRILQMIWLLRQIILPPGRLPTRLLKMLVKAPRAILRGDFKGAARVIVTTFNPNWRVANQTAQAESDELTEQPTDGFFVSLEVPIPSSIHSGKGNVVFMNGWCFHQYQEIKKLHAFIGDELFPVSTHSTMRWDVRAEHLHVHDSTGRSARSGFWGLIPITERQRPERVTIGLQATLRDGSIIRRRLGHLEILPGYLSLATPAEPTQSTEPLIAVCMATYNPPPELFERQIQSIIDQTHRNWICLISDDCSSPEALERMRRLLADDPRFVISPSTERLGFYKNFERSLTLVPPEAQFAALSDQDDYWYPEKLATLLATLEKEKSLLAYSDMRIIDHQGQTLFNTYWTTRLNNHTNLASLMMANTVTGAASLFRRELLDDILPFPPRVGDLYHDHWIATMALALGRVSYVPRPLYDYVQHSANVIGHCAVMRGSLRYEIRHNFSHMLWPLGRQHARAVYFAHVPKVETMASTVLARGHGRVSAGKLATLQRIANLDRSAISFLWLFFRGLREPNPVSVTIAAEYLMLLGVTWRHYSKWRARWPMLPQSAQLPPNIYELLGPQPSAPINQSAALMPMAQARTAGPGPLLNREVQEFIERKVSALRLQVEPQTPPRVNLLIPELDLRYVFGGYLTKFSLAIKLAREGFRVRLVIVDKSEQFDPVEWRNQLRAYQEISDLLDLVEVAFCYDREKPLEVSPEDTFIATTWWTGYIAHHATQALKQERFIYLIQEYEPFTFVKGSFAALADTSYRYPHFAIFSTELLREYFREQRLGVFAAGAEEGDGHSISFENPITDVGEVRAADLAQRKKKKLLFYARPEAHAARNMFELGAVAISQAVREGCFDDAWEFYGIGTNSPEARVQLDEDVYLKILPRQHQNSYSDLLKDHDLGVSLMDTPHPSLVPIEMAAAGMLVVTSTHGNKTAEKMRAISPNIIAAEPSIAGLKFALQIAVANINDYDARAAGARVNWSRSIATSFTDELMAKVSNWIKLTARREHPKPEAQATSVNADALSDLVPAGVKIFRARQQFLEYIERHQEERALIPEPQEHGFCPNCRVETSFSFPLKIGFGAGNHFYPHLREGYICARCRLNNRQRLMFMVIEHLRRARNITRPHLAERVTRFYDQVAAILPGLTASEYLGADKMPGQVYPVGAGDLMAQHQDLIRMSFPDGSKDLMLSGDVIEHVPDCDAAFREAHRVLSSDGVLLFSVPFSDVRQRSLVRARLDAQGQVEHLMSPEIHGNPLEPTGSLAFHSFGWDLVNKMKDAGFKEAAAIYHFNLEHGFTHDNSPVPDHFMGPFLFMAVK